MSRKPTKQDQIDLAATQAVEMRSMVNYLTQERSKLVKVCDLQKLELDRLRKANERLSNINTAGVDKYTKLEYSCQQWEKAYDGAKQLYIKGDQYLKAERKRSGNYLGVAILLSIPYILGGIYWLTNHLTISLH